MSSVDPLVSAALDRVAGKTCHSCGFFDPTALDDDPDLIEKIVDALNGGKPFKCHEGFPTHPLSGRYIPTLEQQKAAPLCAGYASLKSELERQGASLKDFRGQVVLCRAIIRRGQLAPCIPSK